MNLELKRKAQLMIMALLISFVVIGGNIQSSFASGTSIDVTYTKEESDQYILSVKVVGNGKVYDGKQEIRNQVNRYKLAVDEDKVFDLKADAGNRLLKVTLDDKDITQQVKQNSIKIEGQHYNQSLIIYFEESTNQPVKTGDAQPIALYSLLAVGTLAILITVYARRKRDN